MAMRSIIYYNSYDTALMRYVVCSYYYLNIDESHMATQRRGKKLDTKEYTVCDSTYMKFKGI